MLTICAQVSSAEAICESCWLRERINGIRQRLIVLYSVVDLRRDARPEAALPECCRHLHRVLLEQVVVQAPS